MVKRMVKRNIWVTGDTSFMEAEAMNQALSAYSKGSVLVTGDAQGADRLADTVGRDLGFLRVRVPYAGHLGKAGGPVRDALICKIVKLLSEADGTRPVCLAFGTERGTVGSLALAIKSDFEIKSWYLGMDDYNA